MKKRYIYLLLFFTLTGALIFLPYRLWIERRLELILEEKGFENVSLTISSLGLNYASLENISIGNENKLNLKNIILEYSLRDLWNGYLQDLTIAGVTLDIGHDQDRWVVAGLEGLSAKPEGNISEPLALPVTPEQIARIPFARLKLEDSLLNISFGNAKLSLPSDITWQKAPKSIFTYKGDKLAFKLDDLEIAAGNLTLDARINEEENKWAGSWLLKNITVKGTSVRIPMMKGQGAISADQKQAEIKGKFVSDDKLWQLEFNTDYNLAAAEKSNLTILRAGMPWKEGRIDVRNVKILLQGQSPIKMTLEIKSVSVQDLMESLTGDRVSATGKVSGTLPLIIDRNGKITVLAGNLKSEGSGTISMPPDVIPGNNEQVELVRQIMENLQYSALSIAVKNDQSGRLGILMTFEGNNPDVYKGRHVKLNVNLTGDVLDFVQKNILLLTNPEQFLQQGNDEKN